MTNSLVNVRATRGEITSPNAVVVQSSPDLESALTELERQISVLDSLKDKATILDRQLVEEQTSLKEFKSQADLSWIDNENAGVALEQLKARPHQLNELQATIELTTLSQSRNAAKITLARTAVLTAGEAAVKHYQALYNTVYSDMVVEAKKAAELFHYTATGWHSLWDSYIPLVELKMMAWKHMTIIPDDAKVNIYRNLRSKAEQLQAFAASRS